MENTNLQTNPQASPSTNSGPAVSGSNIMNHSEEALRQSQLTMRELMDKINADIVVGEVVDEFEENRQKTIDEQKNRIRQQQEEADAKERERLEEEQKKQEEEEGREAPEREQSNLLSLVKDLSKKVPTSLLKGISKANKRKVEEEPEEALEYEETELDVGVEKGKNAARKDLGKGTPLEEDTEGLLYEEDSLDSNVDTSKVEPIVEPVPPKPKKQPKPPKEKKEKLPKEKKAKAPRKEKRKHEEVRKPAAPSSTRVIHDEYEDDVIVKKKETASEPSPQDLVQMEDQRRKGLQDEVARFHEQTDFEEVSRFRNDLERLSADSLYSVSVYAACIIDRGFTSLSIIKNVSRLAEIIADSDDNLDFFFAYIITNKGVQHYGSDEAISEASLAMEALRSLFIQKRGRVTVEQIQKLRELQIFQTIYYDDNSRPMRR